jgi:uncharacterized protein
MPTSRKRDDNGFLLVKGCPITSSGIFDYGAGQLGLPGDPNRIVKVFRPPEAVSDPAAIESFKDVPLINDHEMLSGFSGDESASAPEDYGVSGVLTGNVYYDEPWMRGDIKVFSREMQEALQTGKKDLSLGYSCDFHEKPGVWQGQPYEVVQTNMRGNHIALVDEGRVPGARVLDGLCFDHLNFVVRPSRSSTAEEDMKRNGKAFDNAVQQLKALLPALEQFLNEEATEPAHQGAATGAGEGEGDAGAATAVTGKPEGGTEGSGEAAAGGADPVTPEAGNEADPTAGGEAAAAAGGEGADPMAAGGEQEGGEGAQSIESLVTEVESVLAKLKAAMAGTDTGDEGMGNEGEFGADSVEGLQGENTAEGAAVCTDEGEGAGAGEGQGHASSGPSAGQHATANDAALRSFYADLAAKTSVYDRLSKVVGAFDHKVMDARAVAVYGVKKLGIKAAPGTEHIALDAYLNGVEAAAKTTKQRSTAADAAVTAVTADMDAYLKGAK